MDDADPLEANNLIDLRLLPRLVVPPNHPTRNHSLWGLCSDAIEGEYVLPEFVEQVLGFSQRSLHLLTNSSNTGQPRSGPSNSGCRIRFENKVGYNVDIYWIKKNGLSVLYKILGPGYTVTMNTYAGHLWHFCHVRGQVVEWLQADKQCIYDPREMNGENGRPVEQAVTITLPLYSLQDWCKRYIGRLVPRRDIKKLPLPEVVRNGLRRCHYLNLPSCLNDAVPAHEFITRSNHIHGMVEIRRPRFGIIGLNSGGMENFGDIESIASDNMMPDIFDSDSDSDDEDDNTSSDYSGVNEASNPTNGQSDNQEKDQPGILLEQQLQSGDATNAQLCCEDQDEYYLHGYYDDNDDDDDDAGNSDGDTPPASFTSASVPNEDGSPVPHCSSRQPQHKTLSGSSSNSSAASKTPHSSQMDSDSDNGSDSPKKRKKITTKNETKE